MMKQRSKITKSTIGVSNRTNLSNASASMASASKANISIASSSKKKGGIQTRASQLYEHASIIQAKKEQRKKELEEQEAQKIESAKLAQQKRTRLNGKAIQFDGVSSSKAPISVRTDNLIERRNIKQKQATQSAAFKRKLAEVQADFQAQVEEEKIRNGPEAAERYKKSIANDEVSLQSFLNQFATEQFEFEQTKKQQAIEERVNLLQSQQEALIEQEAANGG